MKMVSGEKFLKLVATSCELKDTLLKNDKELEINHFSAPNDT